MRNSKQIKQEVCSSVIDNETGEITKERKRITYSVPSEPDFVKVYLKDLLYLFGLPKYSMGVLLWMMQHVTYASDKYGLCTALNSALKDDMKDALGIKHQGTIDNILSDLVKKNVIKRLGRGLYRLNPYLFGRGDWRDITDIRMTVEYSLEGKTIESEIKKAEERNEMLRQSILQSMIDEGQYTKEEIEQFERERAAAAKKEKKSAVAG